MHLRGTIRQVPTLPPYQGSSHGIRNTKASTTTLQTSWRRLNYLQNSLVVQRHWWLVAMFAILLAASATPIVAGDSDQQCMICTDQKHEHTTGDPGRYFIVIAWGSAECAGQELPECILCESFLGEEGDCGENGDDAHPDPPDSYSEEYADLWLRTEGCDAHPCQLSEILAASKPIITELLQSDGTDKASEVANWIAASNGALAFNNDRGALQGLDCRGDVILHVPLSWSSAMQVQEAVRERSTLRLKLRYGVLSASLASLPAVAV